MERPDQILARICVDCGLPAYARINLSEQGGGDLHEAAATLQDCAGKSGQIANHAAAQRKHMIAALYPLRKQPVG